MLLTELPKGEEKMAEEKKYLWAADGHDGLIKLLGIQMKRWRGCRDDWHKC